eukprot:4836812-Heterocapsa_arctica.AAC.1
MHVLIDGKEPWAGPEWAAEALKWLRPPRHRPSRSVGSEQSAPALNEPCGCVGLGRSRGI